MPAMRRPGHLLLLLLLASPLALLAAAWAMLSDQPMVDRPVTFTPEHVERAKAILKRHDPRRLPSGVPRTIVLAEADVDLALNYLADRHANASARIVFRQGRAVLSATLPVPANPLGRYLNVAAELREGAPIPVVASMRVGRLPLPAWLANAVFEAALRRLLTSEGYQVAGDTVRRVAIAEDRLAVTYVWQSDLPARLRAGLVPPEDEARLREHQSRLAAVIEQLPPGPGLSLAELVAPMMAFAAKRGASGDPVAENRAVLLVIAFYANGRGLGAVVPAAYGWPRPAARAVLLGGRADLAKHFAISAAIAAHAGAPLSDAIGLYKEVEDARSGSGFSFDDLAADRAGTRFGELATASRGSATALQDRIAPGLEDAALMPPIAGLPAFLGQAEFERRFGGVGSPAYRELTAEIERRIDALPVYR